MRNAGALQPIIVEDGFEAFAPSGDRVAQLADYSDLLRVVRDQQGQLAGAVIERADRLLILPEGYLAPGQAVTACIHLGKMQVVDQLQELLAHLIAVQRPFFVAAVALRSLKHRGSQPHYQQQRHRSHDQNTPPQSRAPADPIEIHLGQRGLGFPHAWPPWMESGANGLRNAASADHTRPASAGTVGIAKTRPDRRFRAPLACRHRHKTRESAQ